ncbi:hypothetical protein CTI14_42800, partial [Methylobacterium radiotolerans]
KCRKQLADGINGQEPLSSSGHEAQILKSYESYWSCTDGKSGASRGVADMIVVTTAVAITTMRPMPRGISPLGMLPLGPQAAEAANEEGAQQGQ